MRSFYLLALMCFSALTASLSVISCSSSVKNKLFSSDTKSYKSYRDAVKDLNFEAAHDTLSSYREDYLAELSKDWLTYRDERAAAQGKYYQAFDEIYKAEIQYILSELRGDECKDKILFLLEEIPVEGEKMPAGLCTDYVAHRGSLGNEGIPLDAYIIWTQHYNRLCSNILSLAINRKNQDLAKLIILQFVDNVEVTAGDIRADSGSIRVDGVIVDYHHGYIKYTSEDRNAAKEKYDEAVRSGAFQ